MFQKICHTKHTHTFEFGFTIHSFHWLICGFYDCNDAKEDNRSHETMNNLGLLNRLVNTEHFFFLIQTRIDFNSLSRSTRSIAQFLEHIFLFSGLVAQSCIDATHLHL